MRPVFYDYPAALNASCDQSMAFTLGQRLADRRAAQAGIAAALRRLPARRRLVRLLDRAARSARTSSRETPRLDTCRCSSAPARSCRASRWSRARARRRRARSSSTSIRATDCRGELYLDDGITVGGPRLRQTIQCTVTPNGVALRFGPREGLWRPWWKQIAVTVHGTEAARTLIPDQPRAAEVLIR